MTTTLKNAGKWILHVSGKSEIISDKRVKKKKNQQQNFAFWSTLGKKVQFWILQDWLEMQLWFNFWEKNFMD